MFVYVQTCPSNCADRVNLGLIPTSENSWPVACKSLKTTTGGRLHIHGNVDLKSVSQHDKSKPEWIDWSNHVIGKIASLLNEFNQNESKTISWLVSVEHIEYVKSYGPRVDHLVIDLHCKPQIN